MMLSIPVTMSLEDYFALLAVWEANFEARLDNVQQLVNVRRFVRSGYSAERPPLEEGERWEYDTDDDSWFAEHREPWCDFDRERQTERNALMQGLGIVRAIRKNAQETAAHYLESKDSNGNATWTGVQVLLSEVSNARSVLIFVGADPLDCWRRVPQSYFNENQRTATPWDAK